MSHLTATAWGLSSASEDNGWRYSALCAGRWDEWTEFLSIRPDDAIAARTAHACKAHCEVFEQCLADTLRNPPEPGIIQAGRHTLVHRGLVEVDDSHAQCRTCGPIALQPKKPAHGTTTRYRSGCRCDPCVVAKRLTSRRAYGLRKERELAGAGVA